jgi:Sulfotransferase domain
MSALPNLLVIGALKCGTTSLHTYLGLHPEVQMAEEKELDFFVSPSDCDIPQGNWERGLDWYTQRFSPGSRVCGETSHNYTAWPLARGVPDRAAETLPGAKLIYIVRDPIDRIVSHYMERRFTGLEERPLDVALREAVRDPRNSYVYRSSYCLQLEQWLKRYPEEQVLVVTLEELRDERLETLQRVFRFLGVDDSFRLPDSVPVANPSAMRREPRGIARGAERRRGARSLRMRVERPRRLLPAPARHALRSAWQHLLMRPTEPPEMNDEVRNGIAEVLREDVERLRALTGNRFEDWSI